MKQDLQTAAEWLQKAANEGFAEAQRILGFMYTNGLGVEKDLALAREWLEKAAANGIEKARENLANLG